MASFFKNLSNIMQGKPLDDSDGESSKPFDADKPFREDNDHPFAEPSTTHNPHGSIRKGVAGTFPVVQVKHTKTRQDGPNMQVYCRIVNEFDAEVTLHEIRMLGSKVVLRTHLRPDEEREFLVYSGRRPTHKHEHQAFLDYKVTGDGDYFRAIHEIEFTYEEHDKTFAIEELSLHPPIRDIYE